MTTACVRPALQCLAVWLLLPLLLAPAGVGAQVRITGAIAGTVIDASDAVVPGARVQLIDEGTGGREGDDDRRIGQLPAPRPAVRLVPRGGQPRWLSDRRVFDCGRRVVA